MKIELPKWELIPDIGLYLDQVNKFINGYMPKDLGMELTSSMITNYVKLKIVPKGVKKAYSRKQIAEFIIIAYLKTVISMDQIKTVFNYYDVHENTENFYDLFTKGLNKEKIEDQNINSLTGSIINKLDLDVLIDGLKDKK